MKCRLVAVLAAAALLVSASAAFAGGQVTPKQNGRKPLFKNFTSICAVAGYVDYGHCAGDTTTYSNVSGRISALEAKAGVWNLGLSFAKLQPGASYKLWGNQSPLTPSPGVLGGFFPIATVIAGADGSARFSYQTSTPSNLGFDLNLLDGIWDNYGYTVVTSYWSEQTIQDLNGDGTLYVPSA